MKMVFLGAPGAGKGTQAEIVSEKYAIPAISTGAILREAIKNQTELGRAASAYTERGALVPDNIVIGIIRERLSKKDCINGFILDGFPRTVPQAEALEEMGISIDLVVNIGVQDDKIVERMSGRRVCNKCGASFHTVYNPSKSDGKCDKCGETLTIRKDDAPEVVISRLETYHEQTEPLIGFYSRLGKLETVIGQDELADTTALTLATVEKARQKINHDIG